MEPGVTTVRIFGQDYHIRGGKDPSYVKEIAAYLDSRMKEISKESRQVSTSRVAILAALNIVDELYQARDSAEGSVHQMRERVEELVDRLEEELAEATGNTPPLAAEENGGDTLRGR